MPRFMSLWRNLLHRDRVNRDLDDEVRAMFDLLVDEKIRAGMRREDAHRAARLELGGVESVKEQVRDVRAGALVDAFLKDLRYSVRLLRRNPLFTLTAVLSLAIGIGATTTIFTVANGLLLRAAVGVADPDRLVDIVPAETMTEPVIPSRTYLEIRQRSTTLEDLYAFQLDLTPVSLRGSNSAERIFANLVTANYFTVLGVPAAAGRLFAARDSDQPGASAFVVLSHRFWTSRFNANPGIVGQTLHVNGQPLTVVGVAAEGFRGTSVLAADVWLPTSMSAVVQPEMPPAFLRLMVGGRLKPGVSMQQAAAEVDVLSRSLEFDFLPRPLEPPGGATAPRRPALRLMASSPIPGNLRGVAAGFLSLLMALVSLVLVIACANLAGVLLARAAARRREIAVRLAIGAGRAHLVRQLLTETLLLCVLGGGVGLLLARGSTAVVLLLLPALPLPANLSLPLDGRVITFATGLSFLAALLSGLAPALQATKADVVTALKNDEQGPSDRLRLRHAFVVAQVAFSLLLVVVAGLLVRALDRVSVVDRGFDPRGIEVAQLDLSMGGYTDATGPSVARALVDRVRQLPGIQAAAMADRAPNPSLTGAIMLGDGVTVPGVLPPDGQTSFPISWNVVESGYFATMRLPLVAGRDFSATDAAGAQLVAIVPETTARRLWPGQDAVGKYMSWQTQFGRPGVPSATAPVTRGSLLVIGVARDLKSDGQSGGAQTVVRDGGRAVSVSLLQAYVPLQQRFTPRVTILARTMRGRRMAAEIRGVVASIDPNLPILGAQTLEDQLIGPEEIQLRIAASVSGSVGFVGLLLAAIGIYGVTAYAITRRTREIGIRLALGADRAAVIRMTLREGMSLVAAGSAIGLGLAVPASRLLSSGLFGVPPFDPVSFGGAAVLFAVIGLAACYGPVRRAVRISATEALRNE